MHAHDWIIGEFEETRDSHRMLVLALEHSARQLGCDVKAIWLETASIANVIHSGAFAQFCGIWAAPGAPYKNTEGALCAIRWARESETPFIATCRGFQHAALEYGINVGGHRLTDGWEIEGEVLRPMSCDIYDRVSQFSIRDEESILRRAYKQDCFSEKFRCRYCLSESFAKKLVGLHWTAFDESHEAVAFELKAHPFFLAMLFQPHLSSTQISPSPVVTEFLKASLS